MLLATYLTAAVIILGVFAVKNFVREAEYRRAAVTSYERAFGGLTENLRELSGSLK